MILGIDLSTVRQSARGKTRVAVADAMKNGLFLHEVFAPCDDEDLLSFLKQPFQLCGVDAPLSLPPCVLCQELSCHCFWSECFSSLGFPPQSSYHYRLSDLIVRLSVPGVLPKPPLSNGGPVDITPLTMRWQRVARSLASSSGSSLERVVEVYATGSIQLYARAFGLTGTNVFRYRASSGRRELFLSKMRELGHLVASEDMWKQLAVSEDSFDAAMAALSAWHVLTNTVLYPEALLGLSASPHFGVSPIVHLEKELREKMVTYLLKSP